MRHWKRAIRITAVTGLRRPDVEAPGQRHHKIAGQEVTYCRHPDSPSLESTTLAVADSHVEVDNSMRTTRQVGHRHSAFT